MGTASPTRRTTPLFRASSNTGAHALVEAAHLVTRRPLSANRDAQLFRNGFTAGATIPSMGLYVVCHPSADPAIKAFCDQEFTYLSNGDDGFCLVQGTEADYSLVDCVGDWYADPGSGWDVCGQGSTKDGTIVRNCEITVGNPDWVASSAAATCEWTRYGQNHWDGGGYFESCTGGGVPPEEVLPPPPPAPPGPPSCGPMSDTCGPYIAEAAEGSSNNKYLEFANPTDADIALDGYGFPNTSNDPAVPGEFEYWCARARRSRPPGNPPPAER